MEGERDSGLEEAVMSITGKLKRLFGANPEPPSQAGSVAPEAPAPGEKKLVEIRGRIYEINKRGALVDPAVATDHAREAARYDQVLRALNIERAKEGKEPLAEIPPPKVDRRWTNF